MASLYELSAEFKRLEDLAVNGTETDEEMLELLQEIDALNESIDVKVKNGIRVIQSLNVLENGMKEEILRLKERRNHLQRRISQIKDYYRQNLQQIGRNKIDTEVGTMSIHKNPFNVECVNMELLPDEYKTTIPSQIVPNHDKIKQTMKAGQKIPGCIVKDESFHLRIK